MQPTQPNGTQSRLNVAAATLLTKCPHELRSRLAVCPVEQVAVMALLIGFVLSYLRNVFGWVRQCIKSWDAKNGPGRLPADATLVTRIVSFVRLLVWPHPAAPVSKTNLLVWAASVLRAFVLEPGVVWLWWWAFMVLLNGELLNAERLTGKTA